MLRLFLNGKLFWSAKIDECPSVNYAIFDLKGSYKIDQLDTISFTILRTHPMFSSVRLKRATFLLHESGVGPLFFGRVCDLQNTYDFRTEITCEEYFGIFKDDCFSNYYDQDYLKDSQKTRWDTADELITNIIKFYNPDYSNESKDYASINSAWPDLPKITKGFTNYVGESANVQEFDLGGKTFFDVLYSELVSKCGGFIKMRVIGKAVKSDGTHIDGYQVKRIYIDYLSNEDDYRIDPNTGLLYEYDSVTGDRYEVDLSGEITEIAEDTSQVDHDESVDVIEDPSLDPNLHLDDLEDIPAIIEEDVVPSTYDQPGYNVEDMRNKILEPTVLFGFYTGPYASMPNIEYNYGDPKPSMEHDYVKTDDGKYFYDRNTDFALCFEWYEDPKTGEEHGPQRFENQSNVNVPSGIVSKNEIIRMINDGDHRIGIRVTFAEEVISYLPPDGKLPGCYFTYIDDENNTKTFQLFRGTNWITDHKKVYLSDIIRKYDWGTIYHGKQGYDFDADILPIGSFLHSVNDFWIVESLPDEFKDKSFVNFMMYLESI